MDKPFHRPNRSEIRREEYDRIAQNARELGNKALHNIDHTLREQEELWEQMIKWAGIDGLELTTLEARLWDIRQVPQQELPPG